MLAFAVITATLAIQAAPPDPNLLPIGRSGTVVVAPGQIVETASGKAVSAADVAAKLDGKQFLFIGEQHATTAHQQMEALLIRAAAIHGRAGAVGLEMLTRPKQDAFDAWSSGSVTEEQFLDQSDWKHQWGYDFAFYRPIFEAIRDLHLTGVALNVPRDWVRTVGKGGYKALPLSADLQLPKELFLGNAHHRQIFNALMGGHPGGGNIVGMYAAQVLWDEGMADTAIKYMERTPNDPKRLFVVIAGAGHVMYGEGINYRIARRHAGKGITVVMLQSDAPVTVSKGIADFVYVSKGAT